MLSLDGKDNNVLLITDNVLFLLLINIASTKSLLRIIHKINHLKYTYIYFRWR